MPSLEALLELSARHEKDGQGDAPWPPQYAKQPGEPKRVHHKTAKRPRPKTQDQRPVAASRSFR